MLKYKKKHLILAMWQLQHCEIAFKLILLTVLLINHSSAECNVCQSNQAACINSTSYYLCFGERVPNRRMLYHCQKGFDCTDVNAICLQTSSQRPPSCGDTSLCGMCSANRNYKFACLSRTTFQMCYGALRPTGNIGCCPNGYVCNGASDAICVPEETVKNVTCDVADVGGITPCSSSTTSSPPTTTTTEESGNDMLTPTEVCQQYRFMGLYPTSPLDPFCKRYISCFISNGMMRGSEYNCSSGTYFHIQQQKCVFNKPTYCL